ncbi:MAG: hypothetical protein WC965_01125 [Thiohalomonadaceae bacterium]
MGRSVGTHPYAAAVVYVDVEEYSDYSDGWADFLLDLAGVLQHYYDDLEFADGWHGREGRILLENDRAEVVVYTYSNLASVNLVAKEGYDEEELEDNENWCAERVEEFRQLLHANFDCLELVGRFSNGEAVYRRSEA